MGGFLHNGDSSLKWVKKILTSRKNTKFQTCKSFHKNRVKTKENSDACVGWEKEYPAETSVKFPHGYYDMQAAIQIFHETLLAQSCDYIWQSMNLQFKWKIYFLVFIFHKNLMEILYFPKKFLIFFLWSLFLLFVSISGDANIVFMYLYCTVLSSCTFI